MPILLGFTSFSTAYAGPQRYGAEGWPHADDLGTGKQSGKPMNDKSEPTAAPAAQPAVVAPEAKPLLTGPKRQHFLPRFYLEGFTKDGMVAVFDRESNEVRVQQPVNTGVIGHFYTMEDTEGRKRFELEQLLQEYEDKAIPVILKLTAKEEINADERTDFAIFVALAAFRTPDIVDSLKAFNSSMIGDMGKRMFADVEEVKARMRGKADAPPTEEELEAEARELVEYAQSGQYEVTTSHTWAVSMAMKMAFNIAPILAGRDWAVVHRDNEKKSFVTTDAPVLLTTVAPRENSFWGIGFGNTDALALFPLTGSCILAMYGSNGDLQHRMADVEQIRHINLAIADRCQRFVIGREEALVRSLSDHLCLANKKWQPKMQRA